MDAAEPSSLREQPENSVNPRMLVDLADLIMKTIELVDRRPAEWIKGVIMNGARIRLSIAIALILLVIAHATLTAGASAAGTGTVHVYSSLCPAAQSASASLSTLEANCTKMTTRFDLITEGVKFRKATGQNGPGKATWSNVPAHVFTIQEIIPNGVGTLVVFCKGDNGSASYQKMTLSNGTAVHPTLLAGGVITCKWFNFAA